MEGVEWIDMAQERDKWRALVYIATNLPVPYNAEKILDSQNDSAPWCCVVVVVVVVIIIVVVIVIVIVGGGGKCSGGSSSSSSSSSIVYKYLYSCI
jgi:hypothetical protein